MNRLEELAGAATHVAEQSWGVSDATQTAMREIAAILLAASKVDVAGLMTIGKDLVVRTLTRLGIGEEIKTRQKVKPL